MENSILYVREISPVPIAFQADKDKVYFPHGC